MNKLQLLEQRLRSYTVERQTRDILSMVQQAENYAYLVDLNTQQLMQGKDIHGALLTPPYASKAYADFKLMMNPLGVVDLFLTGDFQNSIFVQADKFPLMFDATDEKKNELVDKYGDILGLSEQGKEKFREHIDAQIRRYYYNILGIR